MRAFVTGATGFLGSHLVEQLIAEGAAVAVLVRPSSDTWRIQTCLPKIVPIRGDLNKLADWEAEVARFNPDTIFHLGWHGVATSQRNELSQFDINVGATARLADLATRIDCRTFVGIGSQAEYGPRNCRIDETARTLPTTMYGAAKLAAYHLCRARLAASAVRFAWIRIFSTYGPRDNPKWLIPSLIESLFNGTRMPLTAAKQRWDFTYATDAARAIHLIAACVQAEGVFNLGSGHAVLLKQIVEQIRDEIDPSIPLAFGELPYRRDQVMHLEADVNKLQSQTGWTAETSWAEGIQSTITWHRENRCSKRLAG